MFIVLTVLLWSVAPVVLVVVAGGADEGVVFCSAGPLPKPGLTLPEVLVLADPAASSARTALLSDSEKISAVLRTIDNDSFLMDRAPLFTVQVDSSCLPIGRLRIRLPVAAKIALHSAGANGGTPGSPTPLGGTSGPASMM